MGNRGFTSKPRAMPPTKSGLENQSFADRRWFQYRTPASNIPSILKVYFLYRRTGWEAKAPLGDVEIKASLPSKLPTSGDPIYNS